MRAGGVGAAVTFIVRGEGAHLLVVPREDHPDLKARGAAGASPRASTAVVGWAACFIRTAETAKRFAAGKKKVLKVSHLSSTNFPGFWRNGVTSHITERHKAGV